VFQYGSIPAVAPGKPGGRQGGAPVGTVLAILTVDNSVDNSGIMDYNALFVDESGVP